MQQKSYSLTHYLLLATCCCLLALLVSGCEWYKIFLGDREHNNIFDPASPEYVGNSIENGYFPLKVGLNWKYRVVVSENLFIGDPPMPIIVTISNQYKEVNITKSSPINNITYYYLENFPDPALQGYIRTNAKGDIVSYDTGTGKETIVYNFSSEIGLESKTETRTVPAGTFSNCYLFTYVDQAGNHRKSLYFSSSTGLIEYWETTIYSPTHELLNHWVLKNFSSQN